MTKKITTDATKAKLPRPKRSRPKPEPKLTVTNAEYLRGGKPGAGAQIPCVKPQHDLDAQRTGMWDAATIAELRTRVPGRTLVIPPLLPPVTEPHPWPVRVLNWLDAVPSRVRHAVARGLRSLAGRVEP